MSHMIFLKNKSHTYSVMVYMGKEACKKKKRKDVYN